MKIVVTLQEEEASGDLYFSGEANDCPPLPRVGEDIMGEHGYGVIIKITHFFCDTPHEIRLVFKPHNSTHEYTGF